MLTYDHCTGDVRWNEMMQDDKSHFDAVTIAIIGNRSGG